MAFQTEFALFWESVKDSMTQYTFAKLTLAKTIGDTELKKHLYASRFSGGPSTYFSNCAL